MFYIYRITHGKHLEVIEVFDKRKSLSIIDCSSLLLNQSPGFEMLKILPGLKGTKQSMFSDSTFKF